MPSKQISTRARSGPRPSLPAPRLGVDGRLEANGRAIDLTPTDTRLVAALLDRRGSWCRHAALAATGWPDGVATEQLHARLLTLNRRLRGVGLRLVEHPRHGVALEVNPGWATG